MSVNENDRLHDARACGEDKARVYREQQELRMFRLLGEVERQVKELKDVFVGLVNRRAEIIKEVEG